MTLVEAAFSRPVAEATNAIPHVDYPGLESVTFRYGPVKVKPGQNDVIRVQSINAPKVPGYITRFEPNLVRAVNGSVPAVESLHIHHAAWEAADRVVFSAGEEKTIIQYPRGFGLKVSGREKWSLTYMLHNQVSAPEQVYMTWRVDFVPLAKARNLIRPVEVQWLDVAGGNPSNTFNPPASHSEKEFTFPDDASLRDQSESKPFSRWKVPQDVTLISTVGHIHPGGLYTTMSARRGGVERVLFRSRATYFNTQRPDSYDLSMTATPPGWRVKLRKGDVVSISATVDTESALWSDNMGIMPAVVHPGHRVGGVDPFSNPSRLPRRGVLTHGSLPENRNPGGRATSLPDPRSIPDGPRVNAPVKIQNFRYQFGDFSNPPATAKPPVFSAGQRVTFINLDAGAASASLTARHTVTACRAPCTSTSGAAYPQANAHLRFDSGQIGGGPSLSYTPAYQQPAWSLAAALPPGTYPFFCRIHPFMRGSFRIKPESTPGDLSNGWAPLPSTGEANV